MRLHAPLREQRRFSGRQLTVVIVAIAAVLVVLPTAALAAIGTFTSTTVTPAVTGTNSSAAANAKGVFGNQTGGGLNTRYGVSGAANGTAGIGVQGTGVKYGVFSNGPLGVAAGKSLTCTGCVTAPDLAAGAKVLQPLASGQSESGAFSVGGGTTAASYIAHGITFVRPLAAPIDDFGSGSNKIIEVSAWPATHCAAPGSADPGYLCIYESGKFGTGFAYGHSSDMGAAGKFGASIFWTVTANGAFAYGTWTVTAA